MNVIPKETAASVVSRPVHSSLTSEDLAGLTSQEGNPAKVLQELVQLIQSRLQVDACSVYLIEPDRTTLVLAATVGLDSRILVEHC